MKGGQSALGACPRRWDFPIQDITAILQDLEENLFFLTRNAAGEASWAYPVTSDRTPHHLQFSSGESNLWGLSGRRICRVLRARMSQR